jgi:hypothetical protein
MLDKDNINEKTPNFLWNWRKLPLRPSIYYVRCMEKTPEKFKAISENDSGGCFKAWKGHVEQHVGSNRDNYEKDKK